MVILTLGRPPASVFVDYHLQLVEQGDWENDADANYPRAPLPAHERTWRHPSELGAATWVQSEPPLVVGRGLSVATGAVGVVLALGLLWLIVPRPGGGSGVAIEMSTTSVRSITAAAAVTTSVGRITSSTDDLGTELAQISTTTMEQTSPSVSVATPTDSIQTVPASAQTPPPVPVPTMVLGGGELVGDTPAPPVAVALMPGHFVVTTAAAVRGREGFDVRLPTGDTVVGAVVFVDVANGVAVLSIAQEVDAALIEASTDEISAGGFMVMTPEATSASLWVDDGGTRVAYGGGSEALGAGEGSLVLDGAGRLMGMCTKSSTGVQLVSVTTLLDALTSAASVATPAWLGIKADLDASGRVMITQVIPGGPAAAAGLEAGDVIVKIDGVPIKDLETLRNAVGSHVAGDSLTLSVASPPPAIVSPPSTTAATTATSVGTTTTSVSATTTTTTATATTTLAATTAGTSAVSSSTTTASSQPATAVTTASSVATSLPATTTAAAPITAAPPLGAVADVVVMLSAPPGSL